MEEWKDIEEIRRKKREYMREWCKRNKDKIKETARKSYLKNKEKRLEYARQRLAEKVEYNKQRRKTQIGRASYLLAAYNKEDEKYGRGKGDLTPQWIVENIFSKQCAHCDETDWHKLGCNRLDNSKPHTMDNVEPCCHKCNLELVGFGAKKVYQYTLEGELVKVWDSVTSCEKEGFHKGHVSNCCLGKQKKHKGYIWSYEPM